MKIAATTETGNYALEPEAYKWQRMTAEEYEGCSHWRVTHVEIPYAELVAKLGEPHRNQEDDFPDDRSCVDVCWGFGLGPSVVTIWNYKDGPVYYGDAVTLDGIKRFSVYYSSPEAWESFKTQMQIG